MNETASRKCGECTRLALIEAGLELFGEYGFKGTTTRMLANRAGANISAIPYYFANKKGLYQAVMRHIVEESRPYFSASCDAARKFIAAKSDDKDQAAEIVKMMVSSMVCLFVENERPVRWTSLVMREHINPSDGFNILYDEFMSELQDLSTYLVSVVIGKDHDEDEIKIFSHVLFGQALSFMVAREKIFRHLGVKKYEKKHIDVIHNVIMSNIENFLKVHK